MYFPVTLCLAALLSMLVGCGSSSGGGGANAVTATQNSDNPSVEAQAVTASQSDDFLSYLPEQTFSYPGDVSVVTSSPEVVQRDGDRLYIGSQDAGLTLVDTSNPDALQVLGRYPALAGVPRALYLWDGRLVAVTSQEVVVLDVADPGNIRPLRSLELSGSCQSSLKGSLLYLSCTEQTQFFNEFTGRSDDRLVAKLYSIDLRDARVIDELELEVRPGSGFGVPLFGEHRIYFATFVATDEGMSHRLHMIDIADPTGKLVDSGHVPLPLDFPHGMDEYRGVVRIVGESWGPDSSSVVVATFSPDTSGSLQPSGTAIFPLTGSETRRLATVQFDGPTAYLALEGGEDQSSALVTVDLSDPSQPTRGGLLELDSADWIDQLELQDDRLFVAGLSVDDARSSVALIDLSDPSAPNLLDRFEFDGGRAYGSMTLADQGRLVRIPLIRGAVDSRCPWDRMSNFSSDVGVQLIGLDPTRERLEPGAVLFGGWTRAPQLLDLDAEHLLGVGGNLVQSLLFDGYTLHRQNTVALANNVVRALPLANGTVARFTSFDVTPLPSTSFEPQAPQAYVDFAPAAAAGDSDGALGALHLYNCAIRGDKGKRELQTFARGDQLEILYLSPDGRLGLRIIDASDPVSPQQLSDTRWDGYYEWASTHSVYGGPPATVVRTDHAIVVQEGSALRVIDLNNPAAPGSTVVNLPAGLPYGGLLADGDGVLTSHHEVQAGDESAGSFYLDRISLVPGEPPVVEPPVKIPGELLYQDRASGDLLTRQMVRATAAEYKEGECPGRAYASDGPWAADCVIERLNLVSVADGVATRRDSLTVAPAVGELQAVAAGDGVVFALLKGGDDGDLPPVTGLLALSGFGSGRLAVERALLPFSLANISLAYPEVSLDPTEGLWLLVNDTPLLYATGKRALVLVEDPAKGILALGTEAGRLDQFSVNRLDEGFPYSVAFNEEGRALLALGRRGVKWVETDLDSATTVSVMQTLVDYIEDIMSTID